MSHLRLGRYQDLMLVSQINGWKKDKKGRGVVIYLTIESGIHELPARAGASGAALKGPNETEWNTLELSVTDPDGYQLTFSQVMDKNRSFDDIMEDANR